MPTMTTRTIVMRNWIIELLERMQPTQKPSIKTLFTIRIFGLIDGPLTALEKKASSGLSPTPAGSIPIARMA